MDSLRVAEFETDQERYGLNAEQSSVHIVTCRSLLAFNPHMWLCRVLRAHTEKQVIRMGGITAYSKNLDEIVKLARINVKRSRSRVRQRMQSRRRRSRSKDRGYAKCLPVNVAYDSNRRTDMNDV